MIVIMMLVIVVSVSMRVTVVMNVEMLIRVLQNILMSMSNGLGVSML
jgi:hypothetical protein